MEKRKKENAMSLALLFVGFIWGFGFIAVELAFESGFSSLFICLMRFAVSSLLTFAFFPKTIVKIRLSDVKSAIVPGIFMTFGFFFQVIGQLSTTPGNNALITGSYTVFVPMILAIFFRKRPSLIECVAAAVSFVGIIILYLPTISLSNVRIGDFYSFVAAICFALQFIYLDKTVKDTDPKIVTFVQLFIAAISFLILFLIFDLDKLPTFDLKKGILPVLYLGVFSSFVAYIVQTHAQKVLSPTKVSVIMASEAVFGAILSVLFKYENITIYFILGGSLSVSGLLISRIRIKKRPDQTQKSDKEEENKTE